MPPSALSRPADTAAAQSSAAAGTHRPGAVEHPVENTLVPTAKTRRVGEQEIREVKERLR
jgi:hypothetical protein